MNTEATLVADINPALGADLTPYRLLRELGRGGMSVVYEALNVQTGQRVALKVLALPFSITPLQRTELVARFRREERAVSQLSHPNIVAIHEIGERAGVHYIAMECLPGESLRARLERGPLPLREAGAVLAQVAAALEAVHGAGIVHRDVKPSNIMLLPEGGVKLLDFGVARHSDDTAITSGGLVVGSPAYLSPEQVRGGTGTAASDVWALGVLLSEMLAGQPPFQATDVAAVMYQVIHEPPRPVPGLPPAVAKVLKHALNKAPERRFPSALALAQAFAAALPAEHTSAAASRQTTPALPRWAWATLPLFFGLALLWGFHGRTHAPTPVPSATQPTATQPTTALPTAEMPTAELPASAPLPLAGSAPVLALPKASRVPSVPAAHQNNLAPSPPAALPRHAAQTTMRPRVVSAARPSAPRVLAEPAPSLPRPAAHTAPPRPVPARVEAASTAPPLVTPVVPEPALPLPHPPRPKPSPSDDDAEDAARLQKFIWSEGR